LRDFELEFGGIHFVIFFESGVAEFGIQTVYFPAIKVIARSCRCFQRFGFFRVQFVDRADSGNCVFGAVSTWRRGGLLGGCIVF
jgi:hypothetical protein